MVEIIPAIIPKTFSELNQKLEMVAGILPLVQVDIMDGTLTKEKSWPNITNPDPDFVKIMREEEGFPFWEELEFEFHLMVSDPNQYIQQWISAGAKRIVVHYESFGSVEKALSFITMFQDQFGANGSLIGTELGLAINMDTEVSVFDSLIEHVDYVQFMSIDHDGRQGEPFNESVLDKITALRKKFPDIPISVDGGVNLENAPKLIESGVDRLVVGSALFDSDDILQTIEKFEDLDQI